MSFTSWAAWKRAVIHLKIRKYLPVSFMLCYVSKLCSEFHYVIRVQNEEILKRTKITEIALRISFEVKVAIRKAIKLTKLTAVGE